MQNMLFVMILILQSDWLVLQASICQGYSGHGAAPTDSSPQEEEDGGQRSRGLYSNQHVL